MGSVIEGCREIQNSDEESERAKELAADLAQCWDAGDVEKAGRIGKMLQNETERPLDHYGIGWDF